MPLGRAVVAAAVCLFASSTMGAEPGTDRPGKLGLFDGKSLDGWKKTDFAHSGEVKVEDGAIVMGAGKSMTGITSTRQDLPRSNYELSYEAIKYRGTDFFAAATFPVGKSYLTFVNGGWGGHVTGLSSLNGSDASENETGTSFNYWDKTWYRFRVRVTDGAVRCWIDDKKVVDCEIEGREVGTRVETHASKPLGFATWETSGGVRNIEIRMLTPGEVKDSPVSWKKTVIEGKFRSEGVAIADVNKDGKLDVLIGDSWYEAPSWSKHDIRKPGDYGDGLHSYSACMTCWADDINGDGWADQVVVGFPGVPAYWYENPRGEKGYWPRHEIWHSACNETPLYADLFGDGRRVLVMGWQPRGKDNEGQMAWFTPGGDPSQPWEMHPVSEPSSPGKVIPGTARFAHGLGVGDLNGDGRRDVICTAGWWEQPESGRNSNTPWAFHPARLGDAAADMIAYDVNLDGKADVIDSSAHRYGIWWFEQGETKEGSPVFTRHDLFPDLVSETHALIAADINGDGLKDLVTGKRFWSHGKSEAGSDKPPRLYWFEAGRGPDGKIAFTPREIDDESGIGTQFVVDDFNGDGLLDVVTANKKGVFVFEQVRPAK